MRSPAIWIVATSSALAAKSALNIDSARVLAIKHATIEEPLTEVASSPHVGDSCLRRARPHKSLPMFAWPW
jgi:hypothetical protein